MHVDWAKEAYSSIHAVASSAVLLCFVYSPVPWLRLIYIALRPAQVECLLCLNGLLPKADWGSKPLSPGTCRDTSYISSIGVDRRSVQVFADICVLCILVHFPLGSWFAGARPPRAQCDSEALKAKAGNQED